jgi:hypothetical protein
VTDPSHNEFFFEYYSPEAGRVAKYFPDFLIETSKGRFLVIEVKGNMERFDYESEKRGYKGDISKVRSEVLAKEVGFQEFQRHNKNYEYRIVFDGSLRERQAEVIQNARMFSRSN